ncbi:MAG: hypothetical protein JWQ97_3326 [Phenylobacterium sp.]|nr:hypothetical protein [Phenylobacterium sp.]
MFAWDLKHRIHLQWPRRFCAVGLVIVAANIGVPTRAFTVMRAVEAPPSRYAAGPTITGATREKTFSTPDAVQAFCNFYLGPPRGGYYQACYVPALDLVVLPDKRAWPSAREREELRAHEWAHARGWRHPGMSSASTGE